MVLDTVSAVGLASACVSLTGLVASTSKAVSELVQHLQDADKSISHLSDYLGLVSVVVEQLQQWLDQNSPLSQRARQHLGSALKSCSIIVSDIEEHAVKVMPKQGEIQSKFGQKIKLLWNEKLIKEHKDALMNCFQAFQIVITLTKMPERQHGNFDALVESSGAEKMIIKSAEDAKSILTTREAMSRMAPTIVDEGENLAVELAIDEEIATSGPYSRQFRNMLRKQYQISTVDDSNSNENTVSGTSSEIIPGDSSRSQLQPPLTFANYSHLPSTTTAALQTSRSTTDELGLYPSTKKPRSLTALAYRLRLPGVRKLTHELCASSRVGDVDSMKRILRRGAFINGLSADCTTALAEAILGRHLPAVRFLLEEGADIGLALSRNTTASPRDESLPVYARAIHCAAIAGSAEIIRLLEAYGANVNDKIALLSFGNGNEITPLCVAHVDAIDTLVDLGGQVEYRTPQSNWTALIYAVRRRDLRAVERLCTSCPDANVEFKAYRNWSTTSDDGIPDKVYKKLYLDVSLEPDAVTPGWLTPLALASGLGQPEPGAAEMARILLDAGADINKKIHTPRFVGTVLDLVIDMTGITRTLGRYDNGIMLGETTDHAYKLIMLLIERGTVHNLTAKSFWNWDLRARAYVPLDIRWRLEVTRRVTRRGLDVTKYYEYQGPKKVSPWRYFIEATHDEDPHDPALWSLVVDLSVIWFKGTSLADIRSFRQALSRSEPIFEEDLSRYLRWGLVMGLAEAVLEIGDTSQLDRTLQSKAEVVEKRLLSEYKKTGSRMMRMSSATGPRSESHGSHFRVEADEQLELDPV